MPIEIVSPTMSLFRRMIKTPYDVLGISVTATQDEIKNAYRNLAKKFHPDLNPGKKDAEASFKEINAANELIGTPEARAKYDQGESERQEFQSAQHEAGRRGGPSYYQTQENAGRYSSSFEGMDEDILQSIFGRMGAGPKGDARGADALYELEISFKDAVLGAEKEITLPTGKRLAVKIPAGVESGSKLRFPGFGGPGSGKAKPGDAYVELRVLPSSLFKRVQNNLEIELPVSLSEALLGAEIKVPTINGSVILKVPAQTGSGQRLRVPGKGVQAGKDGKQGDLVVIIKVVMPETIDSEFKESVASWSKRQPSEIRTRWIGNEGEKT